MSTLKLLTVLAMTLALLACESAPTASSKATDKIVPSAVPVPILRKVSGNDPSLRFPAVMLIKTQAELDALQPQDLSAVKVDFSKESLVVVALGQKPTGGYWTDITAIQAVGSQLFVQGLANRPDPEEMVTQAITHPFSAAVIARSAATSVRSDVQSVVGQKMPLAKADAKP